MSLNRRNTLAWILIVLSALAWVYGRSSQSSEGNGDRTSETESDSGASWTASLSRFSRIFFFIASLLMAVTAVFLLYAKSPFPGPDATALIPGVFVLLYRNPFSFPLPSAILSVSALILLLACSSRNLGMVPKSSFSQLVWN